MRRGNPALSVVLLGCLMHPTAAAAYERSFTIKDPASGELHFTGSQKISESQGEISKETLYFGRNQKMSHREFTR